MIKGFSAFFLLLGLCGASALAHDPSSPSGYGACRNWGNMHSDCLNVD